MSYRLSSRLYATTQAGHPQGMALLHYCPGCQMRHIIPVEKPNHLGAKWTWDGNAAAPTVNPSVNINLGEGRRCHYFIKAGHIEFCNDSTHALSGQRVQLPIMEQDWD